MSDWQTWQWMMQQTIFPDKLSPGSFNHRIFKVAAMKELNLTSNLSSVNGPPHLGFYAGTPILTKHGIGIGVVFLVDGCERKKLRIVEIKALEEVASRCIELMDLTREKCFHERWVSIQEELEIFVQTHVLTAQAIEEPPIRKTIVGLEHKRSKKRLAPLRIAEPPLVGEDNPEIQGEESQRLVRAELERDERIAQEDNEQDARTLKAEASHNNKRGRLQGETVYRKLFRRAAQCLQQAMEVDGAVFVDGLVGYHGGVQPVSETEQELNKEITAVTRQAILREKQKSIPPTDNSPGHRKRRYQYKRQDKIQSHTRVFTSAEYQRGVKVKQLALLLGASFHDETDVAETSDSGVARGLSTINEGFLQRLMDRHPTGAIWYLQGTKMTLVDGDMLVGGDQNREAEKLTKAFPSAKQLMFQPLKDPTSVKRLAACFVWRNAGFPTFEPVMDLRSLKSFLRVVESEISRTDSAAAVKQQETFVSSVSHELRTPLHGILGAVQLLQDTGLSTLQNALVDTITTCGSTLHETLTSVLSYAKINQFERRQHKYRQRRPPDTEWALQDRRLSGSGPDRDYEGLYIRTNVAMLCEEIVGVLEAGQSFSQYISNSNVTVALYVDYEDNWSYYTEPGALRRIIVNLVGNALKYTSEGSVEVKMSSSKNSQDGDANSNDQIDGRTLILTIQDTGKGISKDFLENQLFVPFTQEDTATSHGVGLGMSIVKSLVSLLAGEIHVKSEVGKGTEIKLRIPMRLAEPTVEISDKSALALEQKISLIRQQRLTVVVFGLPDPVKSSLTSYLRDWFHCTIVEGTTESSPDIILVDEGNEEVFELVNSTADTYGKSGILLSIVVTQKNLANPMKLVQGYQKWERIPRPLGPNNVANAVLVCINKLRELRQQDSDGRVQKHVEMLLETHKERKNSVKTMHGVKWVERSISPKSFGDLPGMPSTIAPRQVATHLNTNTARQSIFPPSTRDAPLSVSDDVPRKLRILLVDDNTLNLRLLEAFLGKHGYHNVDQANNGEKAVKAFKGSPSGFDMIFMGKETLALLLPPFQLSNHMVTTAIDLSMPVMDGFEATRQIRCIEQERGGISYADPSVIVALTGLASGRDEEDAFTAGVDFYITKPVQFDELARLLEQREEERADLIGR
ncbi:hypothetical protein BU24DRAFT_462395 [Aaosphaeria arxii CBS 175.79]|uniref:Uncharacterized protein n=1 Tax=Aaosphaeria arxii CBS 175.79 TaxID=1450172 RepID=A0A6A5XVD5_9PLEO|nr:uncharacterized protein BU24DRAFT_462395 [Aaosphaeria arxii CBS 175.79]KAF2016214.1 hypothetical protein BU24DRAFT_462395 [Aaosphaeria arxii CBS 175.79]